MRYYVVLDDEGTERHPLKAWIRAHPDQLPEGNVNLLTTLQMVARLKKKGWSRQTDYLTDHELVTPPGVALGRSLDAIPRLSLSQTMFVLPCSGKKSSSVTTPHGSSIIDTLPPDIAQDLSDQRTRNEVKARIDETTMASAIDRYNGMLYRTARRAMAHLMREGAHVVIMSGGYGIVVATEWIGMYDSEFKHSMWTDRIVERCLTGYTEKVAITTVLGVMSASSGYADVFRRTEWPLKVSQVLLATPECVNNGAQVKVPRAQGEALVAIAHVGELVKGWRSSDGLAMQVELL